MRCYVDSLTGQPLSTPFYKALWATGPGRQVAGYLDDLKDAHRPGLVRQMMIEHMAGWGTHLSGANLSEANLSGANLSGANLSGANPTVTTV